MEHNDKITPPFKNTNFCIKLANELAECKNIKTYLKDNTTCNYFNLVFQIKCLGINSPTNNKITK
jgi:hypothetical protein